MCTTNFVEENHNFGKITESPSFLSEFNNLINGNSTLQ